MANLFGLPTPGEVRQSINREVFGGLRNQGGLMGGANFGASAIGAGLGRLFAGESPKEQRAAQVQAIMQETQKTFGQVDTQKPDQLAAYGRALAGNLIQGGFPELAFQVAGKAKEFGGGLQQGVYKDQKELNQAINTTAKEYRTDIAAPRQALTGYSTIMDKYARVDGDLKQFTGADDMILMRTFVKMQNMDKPEAFMSDDAVATASAAMGIGSIEQALNILSGKGTLDESGRAILMDGIGGLAETAYERYEGVRNMYTERAKKAGLGSMTNQFMLEKKGKPPIYRYRVENGVIMRKTVE